MREQQDSAVGERLWPTVDACARGELTPNVALMRLLIDARHADEIENALLEASPSGQVSEALALWRQSRGAWGTVKAILDEADHRPDTNSADPRRWADVFDRLASISPEAGVALYSLGSPALLAAATASLVERLREWGLLGGRRVVLDIGCGIGRVTAALAGKVRAVVGIDISRRMLTVARRRCVGYRNVLLAETSGHDLAALASGAFDLVLAVDTFPYLVLAGDSFVEAHVREAHRVLKPGGSLVLFNFAYGEADHGAFERLAAAAGFEPVRLGTRDLALWDGVTYHVRRVR